MALDLVAFGEPLVEFNQSGERTGGTFYRLGFGGDTSNTAIAAARQGVGVGYFTGLGQDAFGDMFMDLWATEGVDTSHVVRRADAHTGMYFVTHGSTGHVFSYMRAGSVASLVKPQDVPADYIARSKYLHVSGISQAISGTACDSVFEAIDAARAAGVKVAYDTNLRLKLWPLARARAVTHATIPLCDVIFPSLDDATVLTGLTDPNEIASFYLDLGAPLCLLKMGKEGVLVASLSGRQKIAGYKVASVDATGAGDTFDGSFLAMLIGGKSPIEAARYANAAAALSTCGYGAVAPIPRRAEVEAFLRTSN
ncbi:sugar kinase [Rhizobium sp. P32RR-XVIII]|uniref:sugar kinase n=1 Tax=Rhizobium sp. P32RR-XVIII TaxID=2726738 RepID=UPI001456A373|nr:sugar kinase [Rhizobium sp. P32RR-XVIII]NLS08051.1 sugar kinase [Rhizobium sp. P32RR-XVIII]